MPPWSEIIKHWTIINAVTAGLVIQLLLHSLIQCWVSLAAFIFDLGTLAFHLTGASHGLNRMTICIQAYLKRLPARTRKRQRPRSPRVYVHYKAKARRSRSHTWWKGRPAMLLPTLLFAKTTLYQFDRTSGPMSFDTDSFPIGVDSCATCCITDNKGDFQPGTIRQAHTRVEGIGGHQKGEWTGTAQWTVTDDSGRQHRLIIPNTLLVAKGTLPFRLLSPQHFAQQNYKTGVDTDIRGTDARICGVNSILSWADHKYQITTALPKGSNVAIINSTPGYSQVTAFTNLVKTSRRARRPLRTTPYSRQRGTNHSIPSPCWRPPSCRRPPAFQYSQYRDP